MPTKKTERHKVAEALRLSEERFSKAFQNSPSAITLTRLRDGMILEGNESAYEMLGFGHDEVVGKTTYELNIWADTADRDRLVTELLAKGAVKNREFVLLAKGGRPLTVDLSASLIDIGGDRCFLTSFVDITEHKKAEKALRESRARYRDLIETTSDFIWEVDPLGRYTYCSPQMEKLWGLKPREMIGKTPFDQMPPGAREEGMAFFQGIVRSKSPFNSIQVPSLDGRGHPITIEISGVPFFDERGEILGYRGVTRDVTEREQARQELASGEALRRALTDNSPDAIYVKDTQSRWLMANPAVLRIVGKTAEEALGKNDLELYADPEIGRAIIENDRRIMAAKRAETFEELADTPDGRRLFLSTKAPWLDANRDVIGLIGISRDITDLKSAEEDLRQRTEELQTILDTTPAAIFMAHDPEARTISGNPAARELVELPQDMNLSKSAPPGEQPTKWKEMRDGLPIKPDDLPLQRAARGEEVRDYEMDLVFEDGTVKSVMANAAPIRDASGKPRGGVASLVNITRRKQAEERLETTLESIGDGFFAVDGDWKFVYVNAPAERLLGIKRDEVLGRSHWDVFPLTLGTELERRYCLAAKGQVQDWENLYEPWGRWFHNRCFPRAGGGMVVYFQDITEPKRADELRQALAEQEKLRLGAAVEQASDSVVMVDLDGTIRYVNAAFEALNRLPRARAIGRTYFEFLAGQSAEIETIREAIRLGRYWHGLLVGSVDGSSLVEIEVTISPTVDPAGTIIGGLITEKDVTRENALQNQVRQAQKMEALGTLAGGITHDFNNILGTIVLNTELALIDMDPADPARKPLPLVLQAANRGRELVKQIITFSRQRTWEKNPAAIAPIVIEGMKFLRTTLPKDITIEDSVDGKSGVVLADPSHINQILVNLCQNAALAMRQGGGTLRVVLAPVEVGEAMILMHPNFRPGPYVRMTVSDTGCGMTKEVQERIFEPFFTTRGPGEGSGLGLAVVHGIVRTYDGEITVESEPGKGSTFEVYFPRVEADVPPADIEKRDRPQRGTERILLVEDEEAQRESFRHGLGSLGYQVTAAADGLRALVAFQKDPAAFDVVVTDQIMPRMTGLELASEIAAVRPGFPVILCTGFSEKVNEANVGQSGVRELLMKPFTLREATRLIRKVLG